MKSRTLIAGIVGCSLALGVAAFAAQNDTKRPSTPPSNAPAKTPSATPTKPTTPGTPGTMSPEEERMMKAGMVGPQHKALDPLVGTWTAQCTWWMNPESQPEKSTGTQVSKWIFDGRWIQSDFTGDFGGQPFQGLGYLGFDNTQQKYISTWMDSMCTGMMYSTGTADSSGKTFTFTSPKQICMMTGKPCTMRNVLKIDSPDKHTFTFYTTYEGEKEAKSGEIVFSRKK
jgi:hypothetical protein